VVSNRRKKTRGRVFTSHICSAESQTCSPSPLGPPLQPGPGRPTAHDATPHLPSRPPSRPSPASPVADKTIECCPDTVPTQQSVPAQAINLDPSHDVIQVRPSPPHHNARLLLTVMVPADYAQVKLRLRICLLGQKSFNETFNETFNDFFNDRVNTVRLGC
jgi:hypothetical protein